jgi:predicted phage terminase large subunit-like protein
VEHVVEARASGKSARQALRADGIPLIEIEPDGGDKTARARTVTKYFEAGMVYFVMAPGLDGLEHELISFPNATHDDWVDVVVYGLRRLAGVGKQVASAPATVTRSGDLFR